MQPTVTKFNIGKSQKPQLKWYSLITYDDLKNDKIALSQLIF